MDQSETSERRTQRVSFVLPYPLLSLQCQSRLTSELGDHFRVVGEERVLRKERFSLDLLEERSLVRGFDAPLFVEVLLELCILALVSSLPLVVPSEDDREDKLGSGVDDWTKERQKGASSQVRVSLNRREREQTHSGW